jgi:ABC-type sugar transport system substrate-binding protein
MGRPPTAKEQFKDHDDVAVIELGVSRRNLLQQLGTLGMLGGMSGLAGCGGLRQGATESPTASPSGPADTAAKTGATEGGTENTEQADQSAEIPPFTRVPLVPPPTADQMNLEAPEDPERRMDFAVHNATNQFFTPVIAGMNDGLNKLGWQGEMVGPTGNNQARQVEIMNTRIDALQSSRDVLATTVLDAEAYSFPVEQALDNDIPVLQWNTTVDAWDFEFMMDRFGQVLPYIGQRAFPAGNAVGITAYEKALETFGSDAELTVLPCIAVPGHPALQARTDGFVNSIGAQENVTMLDELDVSTDVSQATSRVNDAYNANTDINVILGSGFWGPAAASSLVQNEGLQGEMIVGGFDLPESTLQGILDGTITFTVGQDPYSQGYVTTQLAFEYMDRGIPMKDYITGVSVIDESNIEFANRRSSKWDELVDFQDQNY